MTSEFVSVDGSPLSVYLALPAGEDPLVIHGAIPPKSSILELGSGPGRSTRVLVALGHQVVAVDDSAEMLEHVTGAETVCADLFALRLNRRFDAVVAASHLINHPEPAKRRQLLEVCSRHVQPQGSVLLQRYTPGWPSSDGPESWSAGPVNMTFSVSARRGSVISASVSYQLADSTWTQDFDAVDVTDEMLASTAVEAGLEVDGTVGVDQRWVRLAPA